MVPSMTTTTTTTPIEYGVFVCRAAGPDYDQAIILDSTETDCLNSGDYGRVRGWFASEAEAEAALDAFEVERETERARQARRARKYAAAADAIAYCDDDESAQR
jgi:hypothetical protein